MLNERRLGWRPPVTSLVTGLRTDDDAQVVIDIEASVHLSSGEPGVDPGTAGAGRSTPSPRTTEALGPPVWRPRAFGPCPLIVYALSGAFAK